MNTFFECRVKFERIEETSGKSKKVNLPYLVDAVSFTEAESRIYEEMEKYVSGEFNIVSIKKCNYTELFFFDEGDKWWEAKVVFETIDEDSGKSKKVANKMLVMADNLEEARKRIDESMVGMTIDFEITSVKETKIDEVFTYITEE